VADPDSEQLLAQALRGGAAGTHGAPAPAGRAERPALSPAWVLLIALVLGLLAGAVAGLVTVL
jgi:hypothetical protein